MVNIVQYAAKSLHVTTKVWFVYDFMLAADKLTNKLDLMRLNVLSHMRCPTQWKTEIRHMETDCKQTYLSGQLKTFVAIVISVIHLVVPLSQDHPPDHHSQVNTLGAKIKLLHLQTNKQIITLTTLNVAVKSTHLMCHIRERV